MTKLLIQINYKSGISMQTKVSSLTFDRRGGGGVDNVKWVDAIPNPNFMGVDYIESIWTLDEFPDE